MKTGTGMNKASRIIAWINIAVSIIAGIVLAFFTILGVGVVSQIAEGVDPVVNTQTGLADGEYIMETRSSTIILDECTFSGPVYDISNSLVAETTVYGRGAAECGLGIDTDLVYFVVNSGTARIVEVN